MKNVEALKLFHFLLFSFFLFFFFFFLILSKLIVLQNLPNNEVVCIAMNLTSAFCVALSLFFFLVQLQQGTTATVHEQQPHLSYFFVTFITSVDPQHCAWSHKYHFSAIFSLKLGSTALFTYLKIIWLRCFQFQQ